MLNDTVFCVSYKPFSNNSYDIGIYDIEWNLLNQYLPVEQKKPEGDLFHYSDFHKFNNQFYYQQALGDTLYHVEENGISPFLVVSKGNLKVPFDVAVNLKKRNKSGHNYILGEYCVIEAEDAVKLIPALPEDTNPVILEIELKK
ncbi:MAG: hypothetical protein LBR10_14365 [Prevotellaceae bacterium]|jgi:hypothetical protein|nr:hypothetical protein [Prevotellaceae bacterium]